MTLSRKTAAALAVGMSLSVFAGCGIIVKTEEAIAREEGKTRGVIVAEGDGGIKVTLGEVLDEYGRLMENWTAQYGEENMKLLEAQFEQQKISIMDQKLRAQVMEKKADELKIPADSPEMQTEYEKMLKDTIESSGGQAKFNNLLKASGMTAESYKAEVLKSLRLENLIDEVTKDIAVTDAEISKYYEENKAEDFTVKPGADIYHIFFGKPDDATAETKAKEAKAKLDGGAKFEDIAKEYGQDASKDEGGLLGNFPWDTKELGADFMAEAKKLTEGQISAPVKTSFGWHIIKVANVVNEARVQPLTEKVTGDDKVEKTIKDEISDLLKSEKRTERITALLEEWEKQYNVKRYPERIPMSSQTGSTVPSTTTPASVPASVPASTPAVTIPAATAPAATK